MKYYRLHEAKVSKEEFLSSARTWCWDYDDEMRLYKKQVPGYYSACKNPQDLLAYLDGNADDDEPVAVFEGIEADYTPESDCPGEVWVAPTRLVKWITVSELKKLAKEVSD